MNFTTNCFKNILLSKRSLILILSDTKASVVERFNKTLNQRLYRALTANAALKYLDFLPDLVKGYNASVHNATGVAPKNVTMYNDGKVWKKLYSKKLFGASVKVESLP